MAAFKGSTFKDRAEAAAAAKKALLEAFKTRPSADDPASRPGRPRAAPLREAREQRAAERQRAKAEEEARDRAEEEARQQGGSRGDRPPRGRSSGPRRADPSRAQGGPRRALCGAQGPRRT